MCSKYSCSPIYENFAELNANSNDTYINNIRFTNEWSGFPDNLLDGSEISNDTKNYKALMLVGNKSFGNNVRNVGVWDKLSVNGDLSVTNKFCIGNTCINNDQLSKFLSMIEQNNPQVQTTSQVPSAPVQIIPPAQIIPPIQSAQTTMIKDPPPPQILMPSQINYGKPEPRRTYKSPVAVLGSYNVVPWNLKSFPDSNAKWIWNANYANTTNQPGDIIITFGYDYNNMTNQTYNVDYYSAIDNMGQLYINDNYVCDISGGWSGNLNKCTAKLFPGINKIRVVGKNHDGPAGLILTAMIGTFPLFNTNSEWYIENIKNTASPLGQYDMNPWANKKFPDANAKWIWNKPKAEEDATNEIIEFAYDYNNNYNSAIKTDFYTMTDNVGHLYINNKYICDVSGGWETEGNRCTVLLNPGLNKIRIFARNMGGPAGLLLTAKSAEKVLFHTDEYWYINDIKSNASVLGSYDMEPWKSNKFPDSKAKWIWNYPNSHVEAPSNESIDFVYDYNNNTNAPLPTDFYTNTDNKGTLYVNNNKVCDVSGGWGDGGIKCSTTLQPGLNKVKITGVNDGGPAGLLSTAKSGDNVLFHTDENWYVDDVKKQTFELGPYNVGPWSVSNYPDKNAKWIWNQKNANQEAPENIIKYSYDYNNTQNKPLSTDFYTIVDNVGELYVNDNSICDVSGRWDVGGTKCNATLKEGVNNIKVIGKNIDGPAGLLLTAINDNNVLFHTDNTWYSS